MAAEALATLGAMVLTLFTRILQPQPQNDQDTIYSLLNFQDIPFSL